MKDDNVGLEFRTKIFDICNELFAKNQKITTRYILSLVPDVKSLATAQKYVKLWREEIDAKQKSMMDMLGFSEAFTKTFSEEIARHTAAAELHFKKVYESEKERSEELLSDLNEIESSYLRQQAVEAQLRESNEDLKRQLILANNTSTESINLLEEEVEMLKGEIDKSRNLNEELRINIATQKLIADSAITDSDKAKGKVTGLSESLEALTAENTELKSTVSVLETKLSSRIERFEELQSTLTEQRNDTGVMRQQLVELHNSNSAAAAINVELRTELASSQQSQKNLERLNAQMESSISSSMKRIEEYEITVLELKRSLEKNSDQ